MQTSFVIILLGRNISSYMLALKLKTLFLLKNIKPSLFFLDEKHTGYFHNPVLMLEIFKYISNSYIDLIPVIVACNDNYASFVKSNLSFLEQYYIVTNKKDVFSIILGATK